MIKAAKKITQLLAVASTMSLLGCGGSAETETKPDKIDPEQPVSDWALVWSDEFDGEAINAQNWTHEVDCNGGGNQEKQCYRRYVKHCCFTSRGRRRIALYLSTYDHALQSGF